MNTAERSPDDRPLAGRRVLVTRPPGQARDLSERLRALGAAVAEVPTIQIQDPPDPAPLRAAAASLRSYRWLVVTSVNGVRRLRAAMETVGAVADDAPELRVAAIGPATAREARVSGFPRAVVPDRYRAEALLETILTEAGGTLEGDRILLPRAAEARDVLPEGLAAAGAEVDEVAAYVTVPVAESAPELRARLAAGGVDWVTFTASSTVRSFHALAGSETAGARVAAIGPITAATARELGLVVDVVASEHTIPGLVRALAEAERRRSGSATGEDA